MICLSYISSSCTRLFCFSVSLSLPIIIQIHLLRLVLLYHSLIGPLFGAPPPSWRLGAGVWPLFLWWPTGTRGRWIVFVELGYERLVLIFFLTSYVPRNILFFQRGILLFCEAIVQIGRLRYGLPLLDNSQSVLLCSLSPGFGHPGSSSCSWRGYQPGLVEVKAIPLQIVSGFMYLYLTRSFWPSVSRSTGTGKLRHWSPSGGTRKSP